MEILGILLKVIGGVGGLVASFWFLMVAYEKSIWWCLGCLFVPFVALYFLITNWSKAGRPFLLQLVCMAPLLAGMFLSGPQIGFGNQDQIRRYTAPKQPKSAIPPMPPSAPAAAEKLTYEVPQGWKEIAAGGMRKAAFEIPDGDNKGEVTAISLPGNVGGLLANINRWRGQVNLPDTNEQDLKADSTQMSIGGTEGLFVELVGPESAAKQETILGAIVMRAGNVWFFKLRAPSALAAREKPAFETFLRSIQFSSSDGA